MRRFIIFLGITLLAFYACDTEKEKINNNNETETPKDTLIDDSGINEICGTWLYDLVDTFMVLTIDKNGQFTDVRKTGQQTTYGLKYYKGYIYSPNVSQYGPDNYMYKVTRNGDIMTWNNNESVYGFPLLEFAWYKKDGVYDKKVTDGRWNLVHGRKEEGGNISVIIKDNNADVYCFGEGHPTYLNEEVHLKGTYIHNNGVLAITYSEGFIAGKQDNNGEIEICGIDDETFQPQDGGDWIALQPEKLEDYQQHSSKFTFVVESDTLAYSDGSWIYTKVQ